MDPQLCQATERHGQLSRWPSRSNSSTDSRRLGSAIAKTGLTTRDFVLAQGAALQAGMAHSLVKSGKLTADNAIKKPGVSRANLEFFQKNEARISRLVQDYVARKPKT